MRSLSHNGVTKFLAFQDWFTYVAPRALLSAVIISALSAVIVPWPDPSVADSSFSSLLIRMAVIFLTVTIVVTLLLIMAVPLVISMYTENTERWNIRIASATANISATLARRVITKKLQRSGPGFHGRWLKLPGPKYVFTPCERKRIWLLKPYFVVDKEPAKGLTITYAMVQRWRLKFRYPRRFQEPRLAGWPIPYWGGILKAIRRAEVENSSGTVNRVTS